MSTQTVRARWILPVSGPPIENGWLRVENGRIAAVGHGATGGTCDEDYGDAIMVPGFVNAHTHLDLSAFHSCVPYLGSFTDWVRILVSMQTAEGGAERMDAGIVQGLRESLAAGVTCIADIGCEQRAAEAWGSAQANIVGFFEAIGMGPRQFDSHPRSLRKSLEWCERVRASRSPAAPDFETDRMYVTTISPHAPYSTAPEVYKQALDYCREFKLPICTHLAETRDESEFLARGTGPFRTLLEHRGLWDGSFQPPGCSPVAYAEALGLLACRPLLAHVNYVSDADIPTLAEHGCSVAYCPRTHAFFQHSPHSYPDMLAAGLNVCVGTDSLASNPDLSILEELRFLREHDPHTPDADLLDMGTRRGARALGLESQLGSLEPGKRADLVVLPLSASRSAEPLEDLLRGDASPMAVWLGGRRLVGAS